MNDKEAHIKNAIAEVSQERSRFQLSHFVLGQHDTIEMVYYQCLLELDDLIARRDIAKLEREKLIVEISRLSSSEDPIDKIDAKINEINLSRLNTAITGTEREIKFLISVWDELPKFSREEIEAGQEKYWQLRLTRQAEIQAASESKVSWAHIDAILQSRSDKLPSNNDFLEIAK